MDVVEYYTRAGLDYAYWSPSFNMHFGFWRRGIDLRDREAMLERMNVEVLERARAVGGVERIVDLGCGLGATARRAAEMFPQAKVVGLSLVPWQVERARELTPKGLGARVSFTQGDYTQTAFESESFDVAYALESSCYAPGLDKAPLLAEAHRLLRPGGRLVIADALLREQPIRNLFTRATHRALCETWALETLGHASAMSAELRRLGFVDVRVEDISWNVTPSVAHVPWVTLAFLARELSRGTLPLGRQRWALDRPRWLNALASVPLLLFGLDRRASGYFILSATRASR